MSMIARGRRLARRLGLLPMLPGRRCVLDPRLDQTALHRALEARGVDYVLLHWAGMQPAWGEPLAFVILVADDDVDKLGGVFHPAQRASRRLNGREGRLYTASGLPGTDLHGVPWLPVARANQLLEAARQRAVPGRPRLASAEERLLAMGCEAVYHYGSLCQRPPLVGEEAASLAACEAWLARSGWRPPADTLLKLTLVNPWLECLLEGDPAPLLQAAQGLGVYLIRETGMAHLAAIRETLWSNGFDILDDIAIDEHKRAGVAEQIRGGNWSRGPMPVSGGLPAQLIVVHDVYPLAADPAELPEHVGLDNARLLDAKRQIRQLVNRDCPSGRRSNPAHSSDNVQQALEYLRVVAPQRIPALLALAAARNRAFVSPFPVLADLSKHARRAKVELVDFHGRQAVCKTFRPGRQRFMAREVRARELGAGLPEVSRLLEVGPNHLVFELYRNQLPNILSAPPPFYRHGYLPFWAIDRLKEVILHYRRRGYECVDLYPDNLLYDPEQGLKVIDFEFLQPVSAPATTLKGNYAWYPVAGDFDGDTPLIDGRRPYRTRWLAYTGLPRWCCLYDLPRPLLYLARGGVRMAFTLSGLRRWVKSQLLLPRGQSRLGAPRRQP